VDALAITREPAAGAEPPAPVAPPAEPDRPPRPRPTTAERWARLAGAVAAGLAITASFPPANLWPLAAVGVALLTVACRGSGLRWAALAGWLCGLALFVPLLSWVQVVGVDAWLLLAAATAVFIAGLACAIAGVARLRAGAGLVGCVWVAEEALRDRFPLGGFPWGRLAFGQSGSPLLRLAAVGGAPLVTFAVALCGGLLAASAVRLAGRRWRLATVELAAVAAVPALALLVPLPAAGQRIHGPASAQIAVVQGGTPHLGIHTFAEVRGVTVDHARETDRLAAAVAAGRLPRPTILIWPENSIDLDPAHDPLTRTIVSRAIDRLGVPALVGVVLDGPGADHVRNAGVVWLPGRGPVAQYVKQHLVPFGEYVPWRSVLGRLVGRFSLIPKDFWPGRRPGVLQVGPVRLGDVICFEVGFDGLVRDTVLGGARLLVVQTNNATFEHRGESNTGGESAQQLVMAQLRAVEHGRTVLVAATTGVSAVVWPDGTIHDRSQIAQPTIIDVRVPLRDGLTLADRLGAAPEWLLTGLGVLGAFLGAGGGPLRRLLARRRPPAGASPA
jgi:apolipoprotein N-acyltransferase